MYLYYKFNFMVLIFSQKNQNIKSLNQQKNQIMINNKPIIHSNQNPNQNRNMVLLKPPTLSTPLSSLELIRTTTPPYAKHRGSIVLQTFLNFNMYDIMIHNKTNCESCGK